MSSPFRSQFDQFQQPYVGPPSPIQDIQAFSGQTTSVPKPDGYNPYAAGQKKYSAAGLSNPTRGAINMDGYRDRDKRAELTRQALANRLTAAKRGDYMSSAYLGGPNGSL